ncbi:MAG TPA: TonB family protein [Williamwhitmania sp.]|nr:TonB family protein [Williamwhitmania sp.]
MTEVKPADKIKGLTATISFHVVLLLILILINLGASTPPQENAGILINFGTDNTGLGRIEPATDVQPKLAEAAAAKLADEETPMTQDYQDAPAVVKKQQTKKKQKTSKEAIKPVETNKSKDSETKPQPKVNPKALFPGQKSDGGNQGEGEVGGKGNQGDPNGSPLTGNRIGGGNGNGNVPSFNLAGRGYLTLPTPKYNSLAEGKVVVEITVDRNGNVVKASPTIKGSTVQDEKLFEAAKDAALKAKFNVKQDAPPYQTGTITYNFRLQ